MSKSFLTEDEIFWCYDEYQEQMSQLNDEKIDEFKEKYKPFEFVFGEYRSSKDKDQGNWGVFMDAISYYRNSIPGISLREGETLFVKENDLYCWPHKFTLYFKTDEARTKFLMRWS